MKNFLLIFMIALMGMGISSPLYAQKVTVTGRIVDAAEKPVFGASIVEKGTSTGVMSDKDGRYKITVSGEKSVLVFSFIGYATQEIAVGAKTRIDVVLAEETLDMEEVVVVGYGVQRKASVVGAISTADARDIQKTGTTNLTQAIGGRIAGVMTKSSGGRPGDDDASIFIRGRASYASGGSSPLVLVDGVEREFSQIDPEDIENFSVLKDASATAVFGVRGANGVILITTKRGESAKPTVDLRASVTLSTPIRLPKKLGSYDYARLMNEALVNVGETPLYTPHDLEMYRTGASPYTHPDNDYFEDMLKDFTTKQQYNMVVRGGTPFVRYYVSANFLDERGIYNTFDNNNYETNVYFRRYGLRSNLDFNVTRTTTLGIDLSGRLEERHNNGYGDNLYQSLVRTPPNYFNYINPNGSLGGNLNLVNPYAALSRYGYDHSKRNVFEAVVKLNQNLDALTKGLSARAMFGFVSSMRSRRDLNEKPELWKYDKDGNYSVVQDEESITIETSAGPHTRDFTVEAAVNYDRKFGNHAVTGLLAYNRLQNFNNANLPIGYVNYVGRVTYAYKNKYLAEFNAGYNGSMQFSKDKRYGFFPAFSAGWVVSEENFWGRNAKTFNYLKIRGAYGEVGNDKIGSDTYYYLQTYPQLTANRVSFGGTNQAENRIYEGKEGNSEVGWERARKANIGLDMKFFNQRLSLTVDAFYEHRTGILDHDETISTIYGMLDPSDSDKGFPPQNIGEVKNRGFEIELGYDDHVGKFNYYVRGNFSFARNKIVKLKESPVTYPWMSKIGTPIGQRFGLICDGFYNSYEEIAALPSGFSSNLKPGDLKYRDVNGDGRTDSYDLYPIGSTGLPEIFYGFTLGGEWKGLDFSIFFQGAANSDIYVNGYGYWEFVNQSGVMEHHLGRWTPENKDHATYPSLSPASSEQNHRLSTFWLKNGAYLRLKNVQIGYSLPQRWVKKIGMSNLRIYLSGTNLLTFSEFKEYDPESNDGDGSAYPQMSQYSMGLSIKF